MPFFLLQVTWAYIFFPHMVSLNFPGFSQIYFNVMQISEVRHTYYRYNTTTDIQQAE